MKILPLTGPHGSRSHTTCTYRCGNACDKPIPNRTMTPAFGDIAAGVSRRRLLAGAAGGALVLGTGALAGAPATAADPRRRPADEAISSLDFRTVAPNTDDTVTIPNGFRQDVVVSWGDPILPGAPAFDFERQSAEAQREQFGYNNDFVAILPLRRPGRGRHEIADHDGSALLVANNEYTDENLMFRGWTTPAEASARQLEIGMAAHGMSVVEIARRDSRSPWKAVRRGRRRLNRRITATTPIRLTGPAAGSPLLRTSADPDGTTVLGTFGNCSGGTTPWGTVLSGEENVNGYFDASDDVAATTKTAFERYGLPTNTLINRNWSAVDPRFDVAREPNEPNRFGWVVELDPYDPTAMPVKRTMLGRFKHEAATTALAHDGRVVVYMGDDERFDYQYKFVSRHRYRAGDQRQNSRLLDRGTLYVARFVGDGAQDETNDGAGVWMPLCTDEVSYVAGMSVPEVLVNTRLAADTLFPTRMDRPEDVERNPVTGKVYMVCTNNTSRTEADEANPRVKNKDGHIIEISENRDDPAATTFEWRIFLVCGDPADPSTYFAGYDRTKVSPISCPDNIAFDPRGNLWISTDGNTLGGNDGLFAVPVRGSQRGHVRQFLTVPVAAETCGPLITADDRAVLVAVQHPGEADGATPDEPASTWPFGGQPRPSIVCVTRERRRGHRN